MTKGKGFRWNLLLYACLSSFLFIYALPFIYIGLSPKEPEGYLQVANCTVLELLDGNRPSPPTKMAVWFAEYRITRLLLTIFLIILMVIAEFVIRKPNLRENIYSAIIWIALGAFFLNFLGLMCILAVI